MTVTVTDINKDASTSSIKNIPHTGAAILGIWRLNRLILKLDSGAAVPTQLLARLTVNHDISYHFHR